MSAGLLLTWTTQTASLVAAVGAAVCLLGRGSRAAARSAVWSLTMLFCAVLLGWRILSESIAPGGGVAVVSTAAAPTPAVTPIVLPAAAAALAAWLTWLWAAGTVLALARIVRDAVRIVRLKGRAVALSHEDLGRLGPLADRVTRCRGTRVCWSDDVDSPAALGFGRPVIALPRRQARRLADAQLKDVVLHELAHLRRRDEWRTLAEQVATALMWVNPAVHLAARQSALSREMACDEWVVKQTGTPAAYARSLADVAGLRSRMRRSGLASAVTGRPGMLRRRIAAVLAYEPSRHARALGVLAWLTPVVAGVAAAALLQMPTMFIVAERASGVPTAGGALASIPAAEASAALGPPPAARGAAQVTPVRRTAAARNVPPLVARPVTPDRALDGAAPSATWVSVAPVPVEESPAEAQASAPLSATPLSAAGAAGVGPAISAAGVLPSEVRASERWWSGPIELGDKTGSAAATASRATASFFKRVGSSVPKLFSS